MRHTIIYIAAGAVCVAVAASLYIGLRQEPAANPVAASQNTVTGALATGHVVHLSGRALSVTVVDTPATREQGLSGRSGLGADEGMLFVFPEDGVHAFWMKDMLFSIDILWLSSSGIVVYMAQHVSPDTYPNAFKPNSPARYVLELPAGWAKEHHVQIGDRAEL